MKLVALAGAIASGKSTALNLVKRKGFVCFDLDRYNRQLLESDREVSQLIKDRYGESSVVNNRINRERLRSIIYQKSEEIIYSSNIIENVFYSTKDGKGNEYIIKADQGEIDYSNPNYIYLTNVEALIKLKDSNIININSNFVF